MIYKKVVQIIDNIMTFSPGLCLTNLTFDLDPRDFFSSQTDEEADRQKQGDA